LARAKKRPEALPARPAEVAPLLLQAYGLTHREAEVAQLVLRGSNMAAIAASLGISDLTVQQHLKSVFDKTGVGVAMPRQPYRRV
jgi:DNA-binding CsgD family transcriptional regulator